MWVDNLSKCVECEPEEAACGTSDSSSNGVSIQLHKVQESWYLNSFIFASRPWSSALPLSVAYTFSGNHGDLAAAASGMAPLPNTSNGCGLSSAQRKAVIEEWKEVKRNEKRNRRASRWTDEQRAKAAAMNADREARCVRVSLEPLGKAALRLTCMLEVHEGIFIPLGRSRRARY